MLAAMKAVVVALVALVACSRVDDAKSKRSTTGPTADGVELVTAGASSVRSPLRYHLTKGTQAPLELAMDLEMDAGGRGGKMPTLVIEMTIKVEDVAADGSARIRTTFTSATARERPDTVVPAATMAAMTGVLVGTSFTSTLGSDGNLRDSKLDPTKPLPPAMDAQIGQLMQSLEQIAMRLPDQPVGVGAKWTTRKTVTQNGLAMLTITTVELTAIDGNKVTFATTATVSAPDQSFTNAGTQASVKDVGGGGTSTVTVDLSRMTMAGESTAEFRGTITAGAQTAAMKMAMTLRMRPL